MKYYINNKIIDYTLFVYYLKRSIKCQTNFTLDIKEVNDIYFDYYNDMRINGVEITFKDKMSYKIKER